MSSSSQSTTLQLWHQLLTKNVSHTILATQERFLLGLRTGATLQLSSVINFHAAHGSPEADQVARVQALNKLSFFIAHSLLLVSNQIITSTPTGAPSHNSSVLQQSTTYAPGPSVSHTRSDSTEPSRPGNQGSRGD